jgi:hypothetical protein
VSQTTNTEPDEEVRDPWEVGLSIPSISFADHRVGEGFDDAIIVPVQVPGKYFGKGYEIQKKTKRVTDPETRAQTLVVDRWPDGKPKPQTVLVVLTDLPTDDSLESFMSDNAKARFKTAAESGDDELLGFISKVKQWGLRRFFITGGSLDPEFRNAVRGAGHSNPQPCAYVSARIAKMDANEYGGKTKFYVVKYREPDDASRARVAQYLATGAVIETGKRDETDPWSDDRSAPAASAPAAKAASASGDEPPF